MFICRNAEGVHGQRKVGNPCSNVYSAFHYFHCELFNVVLHSQSDFK